MPQDGEIDLKKLKATFSIPDITLVDSKEIDYANESRLYAELGFAIGLTFLGAILTEFNKTYAIVGGAFILFGLINTIRYLCKLKSIKSISPSTVSNKEQ
jgi:hypothetical protein